MRPVTFLELSLKRQPERRMDRKPSKFSRRTLFRGAVQVSAIGAMAATGFTGEAEAYTPGGDEMRGRYRVADHVKAFYATNGYETKSKN